MLHIDNGANIFIIELIYIVSIIVIFIIVHISIINACDL